MDTEISAAQQKLALQDAPPQLSSAAAIRSMMSDTINETADIMFDEFE